MLTQTPLRQKTPVSGSMLQNPSSMLGPARGRSNLRGLDHAQGSKALRPGPQSKQGPRPTELDTLQGMLAALKLAHHRVQFASKTISARDLSALVLAARTLALYATGIKTKGWGDRWVHVALSALRQAQSYLAVEDELKLMYPKGRPASVTRQVKALGEVGEQLQMAEGVLKCNAGFEDEQTGKRDA